MKAIIHLVFIALLGAAFLQSCVPARKYDEIKVKSKQYEQMAAEAQLEREKCEERDKANQKRIASMGDQITELQLDTTQANDRYRRIKKLNDDLQVLYEKVIAQNDRLMNESVATKRELTEALSANKGELAEKQMALVRMEGDLKLLEAQLKQREEALKAKEAEAGKYAANSEEFKKSAEALRKDLEEREKRVKELEAAINTQNQQAQALKAKINEALLGFKATELTVTEKEGKVYVSLSQELLFATGSKTIDPKGKEALAKLAGVLKNSDINILIEGHTDDVGEADLNWDLSVGRATSVVKELTKNGVKPERVTAAGRGEFLPIASNATTEGKAKNRRTDIILTPDLSKLFELIGK